MLLLCNEFRKNYLQQRFLAIANFAVSSRLRFARIFILVENKALRSSQPCKGGTLCDSLPQRSRKLQLKLHFLKIKIFRIFEV